MANKSLNRTVEEVNTLLDKLSNDYTKETIDIKIAEINSKIESLTERVTALETKQEE